MQDRILLLALVALAGCNSAQKAAEYAATRDLIDPGSAQFREVRTNHEGVVCGEVKGKHRDRAFTGFRKFIYYSHTGHALLEPEGEASIADAASRDLDAFHSRYTIDCR